MHFHRLALSAIALLTVSSLNNGFTFAEEVATEQEASDTPTPYAYPDGADEFNFEADVNKMLDIVVHSLYQNKDVFLRELISNASDALDKIRFLSIENPELNADTEKLEVRIEYDEEAKSITIRDTGVGMTKEDLSNYLGTVAKSGTTKFLEAMKDGDVAMDQIGQFGVGFYSSFLVSDRVRVASKHPESTEQYIWETQSEEGSYHVYKDPRGNTLDRGTEVTLFLKEDAMEYCDADRLRELAEHFSEFVIHPIHVRTTEEVEVDVEDDEEEDDKEKEEDEEEDDFEMKEDDEEEKPKETEMVTHYHWDQVNTQKAIWSRDKEEITDEDYQEFWKAMSKSENDAVSWNHFSAEGNINFKSIIYLPDDVPPEFVSGRYAEKIKGGLKMYVKKVLISDAFDLMPNYLSFIKGVVDSDDLPLNVGRDTLQESKLVAVIQKKLTRKALEMIRKLSLEGKKKVTDDDEDIKEAEIDADGNVIEKEVEEEEEDGGEHPYITWYKKFGPALKFGTMDDYGNRSKLQKLLRYHSSTNSGEDDWTSLEEYVANMPEWQEEIYYIAGATIGEVESSVFMKKFKRKGIEVLYMTEPVDEYMIGSAPDFDGKKFKSITKENIKFNDEDQDLIKRREKVYKDKFNPLTTFLKGIFGKEVSRVVISKTLEDDPAVVSTPDWQHSANMERVLRAQAYYTEENDSRVKTQRIFEINPRHPFVTKLLEMVTPGDDEEDFSPSQSAKDLAWMLHDMALLNSGFPIIDNSNYSERTTRVLQSQLGLDSLDLEDEIDPPVEEEEEDEPTMPDDFDASSFDFGDTEDLGEFVVN